MSFKRYRIIFILIFFFSPGTYASDREPTIKQQHVTNDMHENAAQSENKEGRALLFPRVEYNGQWTPVGRGDPLKDPTYDYLPPVLDRVRYWGEGTSNKNKNDILLLGVPSKKLSAMNKKSFGPVKRNYYSAPYQSHFSSQLHHHQQQPQQQQQQQQQQHHPQRLIPSSSQRLHATDSHPMMSTHHYQQQQQPPSSWNGNVYHHSDARPESSISYKTVVRPPVISTTTTTTVTGSKTTTSRPSTHFLPTLPPSRIEDNPKSSSTPTTSTTTTFQLYNKNENGHMMSPSTNRDTTKPLLHSILQTETAAPFTKKPSSVYQIEFTSHIYNPEAINSMATSSYSSTTFMPTKPSIRPVSIKATTKASSHSSLTHVAAASTMAAAENEKYYVPEIHMGWPVYNLIIEGHSKVKTYGSKNDDPLGSSMPKIRPIQAKENPIVEHVTDDAATNSRPEYGKQKIKKEASKQTAAMTSLLSLLDGSFGNFLGSDGDGMEEDEEREEVENKKRFEGGGGSSKRKTRSVQVDSNNDDKQERVVGVSFQVDDVRPQIYRKGTVVSESLWPFQNADTTR